MSISPREIITLQVGQYSNFIGTHWWNLQEASFIYDENASTEINHNFLFRTGCLSNKEVTFTPRLVVVDFKSSLGSLPKLGTLYDNTSPSIYQAKWDGKVKLVQQLVHKKNRFLQALDEEDSSYQDDHKANAKMSIEGLKDESLQDEMNIWSDFLRPHLHPKSMFTFKDVWHDEDSNDDRWSFQEGANFMKGQTRHDEMEEKIRFQAESCDSLQGFHLLCDGHDGMGGVASIIAEYLQDEFGLKEVFSFISNPSHFNPSSRLSIDMYLTSLLQCYSELGKFSTVVTPLNLRRHAWQPSSDTVKFPHVDYNAKCAYETSSILASFLETVTSCYRSKENPLAMRHVSQLLTPYQKKFVSGSLRLPLGMPEDGSLIDSLKLKDSELEGVPISGQNGISQNLCSVRVLRGIQLKSKTLNTTIDNYMQMSKGENPTRFNNVIFSDPLTTSVPYPHIFKDTVTTDGFINVDYKRKGAVSKVSSMGSLNQSHDIKLNLLQILKGVDNLKLSKLPKLIGMGIDTETWKEVIEEFLCIIENYET